MRLNFKIKCFFVNVLILIGMINPLSIVAQQNQATVAKGIRHILDSTKNNFNTGIIVNDAKTGRLIFSQRADYLYSPASIQKLFTAVAALYYLKPDYRFKTKLLTNGSVDGHVLNGNLIVKFSGDPDLLGSNLRNLIGELKEYHIKKINGKVIVDDSAYNNIPYPPGWMWSDLSYDFAAPLSAIILNRNSFVLQITPAKQLNAPPKLETNLPDGVLHFENNAKTTKNYTKDCPFLIYSNMENEYHISGCINKNWGRQTRTLAIRNPAIYAEQIIKQSLDHNQIEYRGIELRHAYHENADEKLVLATHLSPPLRVIVRQMLKKSENLLGDTLLKKLGQTYYRTQGSWQNGLNALEEILKPTGINFDKNEINDGAGLSRYNLVTPRQFSKLLLFAYHKPFVRSAFLPALPVAAQDGTLASRMHLLGKSEHVKAKTGSMAGVSALAGYIYTRYGSVLTFVIIMNGFVKERKHEARQLQDRISIYLARHVKS